MLLELRDVDVHYGKIQALKSISMIIKERTIVCLIGANGAGKSTVLGTISGLNRPTKGEIWFDSRRINRLPIDVRVGMGIVHVPEGRRIFTDLTVQENLNMGSYTRKGKQLVKEDLEKVFKLFPILLERKNQRGGSLSGGEQQMLALARGLMASPKILLLDEPSLGLDPVGMVEVRELIKNAVKEGMTVFLSSHLLFEVQQVCSHVTIINKGVALVSDTIQNVEQKIKGPMAIQVEVTKLTRSIVEDLRKLSFVTDVKTDGNRIDVYFETKDDVRPQVSQAVTNAGGTIVSMNMNKHSLEDVFVQLVGKAGETTGG